MEPHQFYGHHKMSSSSDDSDGGKSYEPSPEEMDSSDESDASSICDSDDDTASVSSSDGTVNEQPAASNHTAWQNITAGTREFVCTASEQIHYNLPSSSDRDIQPIDVYKLFCTDEVIDLIVMETNRYFEQTAAEKPITRLSKMNAWKPVTSKDIQQFLGILIMMGLNRQPTFDCYWAKSKMYGVELVKNVMPRNKFELILRFLHFADNSQDESDRLYKVRSLIRLLSQSFEKVTPGEKVVIDESLVMFRGRTILRQYIPNKKHKYGFKIYKLCSVDGYTWKFKIYKGKGDTSQDLKHSEYVAMSLMEGLLREGRTLYIDNFYSSVALARVLLEKSTYVCGTLRSNRKENPKIVTDKKLKKGEVEGKENSEGIKVLKWKDKRNVLMLTTVPEHTAEKVTTVLRRGTEAQKPQSVLDYNAAKKGVDYSDQMSSYYSPLRKIRKWYKKLAFELILGTAVVNSFLIFNKYHAKKTLSMKEFRESLVLSLTTGIPTEKISIGRESLSLGGKRSSHFLVELQGQCRTARKRCRGCYQTLSLNEGSVTAAAKARRVKTVCNQCDGSPHMCIPCFERIHSE